MKYGEMSGGWRKNLEMKYVEMSGGWRKNLEGAGGGGGDLSHGGGGVCQLEGGNPHALDTMLDVLGCLLPSSPWGPVQFDVVKDRVVELHIVLASPPSPPLLPHVPRPSSTQLVLDLD